MNAMRGWIVLLAAVIITIWLHALDELNVRVVAPWMHWLQHRIVQFYPYIYYLRVDKTWITAGVLGFVIFILVSILTTIIWPWNTISEKAGKKLAKENQKRLNRERRENVAR